MERLSIVIPLPKAEKIIVIIEEVNPDILGGTVGNKIGMIVTHFYKTTAAYCVPGGFRHINLFHHLTKQLA